jgi:hypothetical protein
VGTAWAVPTDSFGLDVAKKRRGRERPRLVGYAAALQPQSYREAVVLSVSTSRILIFFMTYPPLFKDGFLSSCNLATPQHRPCAWWNDNSVG